MADATALFGSLIGEPCNAVSFVMDYVEFHFNGQVIRALTAPSVERGSEQFVFPQSGSRDALCDLIEDTVAGVRVSDDIAVDLRFVSGAKLSIPLGQEQRIGPEALHFMKDGQFVVIW